MEYSRPEGLKFVQFKIRFENILLININYCNIVQYNILPCWCEYVVFHSKHYKTFRAISVLCKCLLLQSVGCCQCLTKHHFSACRLGEPKTTSHKLYESRKTDKKGKLNTKTWIGGEAIFIRKDKQSVLRNRIIHDPVRS